MQLEQKLYNAKYAECEKVGKTHNAVSMVKRLQLLEDRLAEVRYCRKFDLCEAMDMVYNTVAPVPSIMTEAMVAWQASGKTQDDLDTVLIQVNEKAEPYALGVSNSTQNTPQPNNKVKQHHNHSGSSRGYQHKSNTRSQPSRGREYYAFNRGKCSADHCPFDHVSSPARSQSSWRSNSNSKSVNLVQFEEVQGENRAIQSELHAIRNQLAQTQRERDSFECNLVQLYAEHVGLDEQNGDLESVGAENESTQISLVAEHCVESENAIDVNSDTNGGADAMCNGVSLQQTTKRPRAPTELERLRQIANDTDTQVLAPLIDNCTDVGVVTESDSKKCSNRRAVPPLIVSTVSGKSVSDVAADMPTVLGKHTGRILKTARRSLIALGSITEQGYTYVQQANSAGLIKGDAVIECPAEGNMFRLPTANTEPARAAEMKIAAAKFKKFVQKRMRNQLLEHNRTHNPTDAEECDSCKQALITKEPSKRKEPNQYRNAEFDALVLTVEFISGLPRDNDGNTNASNFG